MFSSKFIKNYSLLTSHLFLGKIKIINLYRYNSIDWIKYL